jgi:hypothetical protein
MASPSLHPPKTVTIIQININSLRSRVGELNAFLKCHENAICVINDTRLHSQISDPPMGDRNLFRCDSLSNDSRAGGVAISIPSGWSALKTGNHLYDSPESLSLLIFPPRCHPFKISTIYNHPGKFVPKSFLENFRQTTYNSDPVKGLILGDFNSPNELFGSRTTTPQGRHLFNAIIEEDLIILNDDSPTYYSASTGRENILDLALCEPASADSVSTAWVGEDIGSDHLPLMVSFRTSPLHPQNHTSNRQPKFLTNWSVFEENLIRGAENLQEMALLPSTPIEIDSFLKYVTNTISNAVKNSSHIHKPMGRKGIVFSRETQSWIKTRRFLNKQKRNPYLSEAQRKVLRNLYNRANHIVSRLVREEDREREAKLATNVSSESDPRKKWKLIKHFLDGDNSPASCPLIRPDGSLAGGAQEKADMHSQRLQQAHQTQSKPEFDEVWKEEVERTVRENSFLFSTRSHPGLDEGDNDPTVAPITLPEVLGILASTKSRSAPGEDGISYATLKQLPVEIWNPIITTFNICLGMGYFPKSWKHARVRMIPKGGKPPSVIKNHRPISLLPCLAKIFERVLSKRLVAFLEGKGFFNEIQTGYRKGRSAQEHLLRLSEAAYRGFKENKVTAAVLLDVEGAFDTVWHDGLRIKLMNAAIPDKMIRLISSFLTDRTLHVTLDGVSSTVVDLDAGTPQGSSLSSTLYIIYKNDAPLSSNSEVDSSLFADDMGTWTSDVSLSKVGRRLQVELTHIEKWCCKWRVCLCPAKTQLIVFSRRPHQNRSQIVLKLFGERLRKTEVAVLLGANFTPRLTWDVQAEKMLQKAWPRISLLRRISALQKTPDSSILLMIYQTFIRPIFDHAAVAFANMSQSHWLKLERLQNCALRCILKLPAYTPIDVLNDASSLIRIKVHLLDSAEKRLKCMLNRSPLIQHLFEMHRIRPSVSSHRSPLEAILNMN